MQQIIITLILEPITIHIIIQCPNLVVHLIEEKNHLDKLVYLEEDVDKTIELIDKNLILFKELMIWHLLFGINNQ